QASVLGSADVVAGELIIPHHHKVRAGGQRILRRPIGACQRVEGTEDDHGLQSGHPAGIALVSTLSAVVERIESLAHPVVAGQLFVEFTLQVEGGLSGGSVARLIEELGHEGATGALPSEVEYFGAVHVVPVDPDLVGAL